VPWQGTSHDLDPIEERSNMRNVCIIYIYIYIIYLNLLQFHGNMEKE
jgi:hypothetical protein